VFFVANIFPAAAERFLSVVFFPPEEIINSEKNVISGEKWLINGGDAPVAGTLI
jgi:hypothetical protein